MEEKKKKLIIDLIPCAVTLMVTIAAVLYAALVDKNTTVTCYLQAICCPLIALIIPLINRVFKIHLPYLLGVVVTVHAILAMEFASLLEFYDKILWIDKFLHGSFGFICAFVIFILFLYAGGRKINKVAFFALIFLAVMGIAALWEIWEFSVDSITGDNCQRWRPTEEILESGITLEEYYETAASPMTDTMWDIIVTTFGILTFFAVILVDKFTGFRLCRRIWRGVDEDKRTHAAPPAPSPEAKRE